LAVLLVWAATAKARRPDLTRESFARLGVRWPDAFATGVPVAEGLVAVLVVVWPPIGGAAAFGLLVAFTIVLARVIRSGAHVGCACFGSPRSAPVSWVDLARNGGLLALSLFAMMPSSAGWPGVGPLAVVAAFLVAGGFMLEAARAQVTAS
jgi:hypothetical protein